MAMSHTEGDCIVGLGIETGGDNATQKVTSLSASGCKERSKDKDPIGDIITLAKAVGDIATQKVTPQCRPQDAICDDIMSQDPRMG